MATAHALSHLECRPGQGHGGVACSVGRRQPQPVRGRARLGAGGGAGGSRGGGRRHCRRRP
eukprot:1028994-Lingulodinium_polyedra.AAC.1